MIGKKYFIGIVILFVLGAAIGLAYLVYFGYGYDSSGKVGTKNGVAVKNTDFQEIRESTIVQLKNLRRFGDWPVTSINLSQQRGNPFVAKQ